MRFPSRTFSLGLATVLLIAILVVTAFNWLDNWSSARTHRSYSDARRAFQSGNHEEALSICNELLATQHDATHLLLMAGESASRLKRYDEAIAYYDRVPDSAKGDAAIARWAAGEVTLQMGQMSATIDRMEQSLAIDATIDKARDRLIYLLNLAGRRWEAFPHLFEMVRQDRFSIQHLLYLGNIAKPVENAKELNDFLSATPSDRMPLLGLARIQLREGNTPKARTCLSELLEKSPGLIEAHVQLGKLLQQADPDHIAAWNRALPANADSHPEIWLIRGEWARDEGQFEAAARCFSEAIRLDPDHLAAINALIRALASLNQSDRAKDLIQRSKRLEQLALVLEQIMSNEWSLRQTVAQHRLSQEDQIRYMSSNDYLGPIQAAAQKTYELNRYWESMAWSKYGLSLNPSHLQLQHVAELAKPMLASGTPRTNLQNGIIDSRWVQSLKLPDWGQTVEKSESLTSNEFLGSPTIRFTEVGDLAFSYHSSRRSFEDGRRMFEITGGGVGVLDYNEDGWPDLFLSQGSDWPPGEDTAHSDRLKRNLGDKDSNGPLFDDVTERARISEHAFGQGVAIGDVDCDGFDDVYVCNFGVNQLWFNQGDGTYRDGSSAIEPLPGQWTVSAAIADLNSDGLAEIYDANYVEGDDVATRRCSMRGVPRACSPLNFQPARARLLAVDPNGVFRQVPEPLLSDLQGSGNALGVVVFRLSGQSLPSIFVANDQVANSMLISRSDASASLGIRYEDQALLRGVAYDAEGKAQACMGVAAGDINQDGEIDLLVTNYFDETNTLYLQESNGSFRDATRSSGLVGPSLKMLGFGAQFLDAQNDGMMDLVVLNGHIDDMSHAGMGYRMRAQFFLGTNLSKFVERTAGEVGAYFEKERLGRALALLDFNRDGRQDFVATDLDGPASLVRNDTTSGNYITLGLVGTKSHRDAIGTMVRVFAAGTQWTQQLVGGCGYMVTNEKAVRFGLGSAELVNRIELHWPSGTIESYTDLPVNSGWIAVEGTAMVDSKK